MFSSFFVGYALFCFVGGWASDRFGAKRTMTVAMLGWSLTCGLTAVAFSLPVLLTVRTLFGMGEGPFCSTASKTVSNWCPRREQASAVGLANAGEPLGAALAGPIVGLVAATAGWRVSFVAVSVIGFTWVACWAWLTTDKPRQHPRITRAELDEISDGPTEASLEGGGGRVRDVLKEPAVLATALAFFAYAYVLYFFLSWFPSYLVATQHLSMQHVALVSVIPWLLGFVGLAAGGFVSDHIYRSTGRPVFARKSLLIGSMIVTALAVASAGFTSNIVGAVALTALAVFSMYLSGNTYFAIIFDLVDKRHVGSTTGFVHMIANCSGIVGPALTGYLVEWTGTYVVAFVVTAGIVLAGAIAVAVFVKAPGRPETAEAPVPDAQSGVSAAT